MIDVTGESESRFFPHMREVLSDVFADEIFDLVYSIPAQNRAGATFKIPSSAERHLHKLKDGTGRYLINGSGHPDCLLGYAIEWVDSLPDGALMSFGLRIGYAPSKKMSGNRCDYCGVARTSGDKFCRDGCGAPY